MDDKVRGEQEEDDALETGRIRQWIITAGVILLVAAPILIGLWLLQRDDDYAKLPMILIGFGPMAMIALVSALSGRLDSRMQRWRRGGPWNDD